MTQFTDIQIDSLKAPLARDAVKTREQGKSTLSYIEAWHAIDEANRIFGFDAWDRETVECRCVMERERKIGQGQYQRDGWGVTYTAKVRITVGRIIREGTGAGHGIDADLGLAHESAIKEAESDAMKRALMTFGNPFGLALYDKTQSNVEGTTPPTSQPPKQETQKAASKDQTNRELYAKLVEDMRLCKATADLARWWKDAECVQFRKKLPSDWQKNLHDEFVALGFELKREEDAGKVVDDIQDTFPGSTVVNERIMHPLMAGE